jgi:hypothetical protein
MYKVKLVTNHNVIKKTIKTFDTLLEAQHCAYLNFTYCDVITINGIPFTKEDYEDYLDYLNYIEFSS